jgi:hypothetical protein
MFTAEPSAQEECCLVLWDRILFHMIPPKPQDGIFSKIDRVNGVRVKAAVETGDRFTFPAHHVEGLRMAIPPPSEKQMIDGPWTHRCANDLPAHDRTRRVLHWSGCEDG